MKAILLTDKRTGEQKIYGSFAAIFEHLSAEEVGITYKQSTNVALRALETENFIIRVFPEIIKSTRQQKASKATAELRGLGK